MKTILERGRGWIKEVNPVNDFWLPLKKSMESWVETKIFCSAYHAFSTSTTDVSVWQRSCHSLSTHHCPQSAGFRYCNLIIPHGEGSSYPPPRGAVSRSVDCSHGNLHQYPADVEKLYCRCKDVMQYNKGIVTCILEIKIRFKILVSNTVIKKVTTLTSPLPTGKYKTWSLNIIWF